MSTYTIAKVVGTTVDTWTKVSVTKAELMDLISGIPEFWLNENNPLENFYELRINAYVYRGSGTIPPETGIVAYVDDVVINTKTGTCGDYNLLSATIEDASKSWSEDQFNGGMLLITSGKVKGFSFKIEDTFSNYISVPTEFPCENVIKNITSATNIHPATTQLTNSNFDTGDFTGWDFTYETEFEGDMYANVSIATEEKYNGSYSARGILTAANESEYVYFILYPTIPFDATEIDYVSFYYNIPHLKGSARLYVKVITAGPSVVDASYTEETDGWVRVLLDVSALSGEAYLSFNGDCPIIE